MLNKLTKCCSILAMFALYFLSAPGASAQCESVDDFTLIVSGSSYASEVGWRVEDADGTVIAQAGGQTGEAFSTCPEGSGQGTFNFDLTSGTDYTFVFIDCWGDGWNGGTAIMYRTADTQFAIGSIGAGVGFTSGQGSPAGGQYNYAFTTPTAVGCGCMDETSCNYDPTATTDDGSCAIPGCMDETACNYDACANEDDGSCASETIIFNLGGSYPPETSWAMLDDAGNEIAGGSGYPYSWPYPSITETICVNVGCYTFVAMDSWGDGWDAGYTLSTAEGVFFSGNGNFGSSEATDFCFEPGCSDPNASNFSALATEDDGSCEYLGCMDPNDYAYDPYATTDDGSCLGCNQSGNICYGNYGNTEQIVFQTGVPLGNDGLYFTILSGIIEDGYDQIYIYDGLEINADNLLFADGMDFISGYLDLSGTLVYAPSGFITVTVDSDGSVSCGSSTTFAAGWEWEVACNVGCMDSMACNYDPIAGIDDGTCDYSCVGCMDTSAANFDPNATIQGDGSCVFCDAGTFVLNIEMTDAGGDGWEGAQYFLTDLATDEMISGDWDNAGLYLGDVAVDFLCMPLGCYTFSVGGGSGIGEVGATVSDQFGTTYLEGTGAIASTNIDFGLTGLCGFEGCTDPYCWNFDISATIDDGSCICPPLNNAVEDAIALECGSVVNGTVANASDVEGIVGQMFGGHTINQGGAWYQYNASGTQQVFIDLCGTPDAGFADGTELNDSQIHVFVEDNDGNLVMVASNDESCFSHAGVSIVTDVAETYYIHVSAYGAGDGGQFQISVNCTEACTTGTPFNDDCAGALPQLDGIAFSGSTCCTNQEGAWSAGNVDYGAGVLSGASTYGVWFTFNSSDFDSFDFNLMNGDGAAVSLSIYYAATNCDEVAASTVYAGGGIAGCNVTGQCAGSISSITDLIPNTDYYFLVGTTDPGECGTFSFSTTGIYLGCMDPYALNYDSQATEDDGSCDYEGITPFNDLCENAAPLLCNTGYTEYSMGGATEDDLPMCGGSEMAFDGCLTASYGQYPSATFTPTCDGNFANITTCAYAGEYSLVNVIAGNTYTFASSNPDYFLTVANSTGTAVLAAGIGEVEYVAATTGTVRAYRNVADCGSQGGCTTFSVSCGGTPPGGVWFTFEGTGELHNINTCGSILDTQLQLFTAASGSCDSLACTTQIDGTPGLSQTSFETCGFFDQDDASLTFVSEVGVTYYVYAGTDLSNNGSFQIEMTCEEAVYGCMVDIACNYNPLANLEDDCDFTSCACSDETQTAIVIEMFDAFGDGWSGGNDGAMGGYEIQDMDGNVYASGTLEEALYQVDEDNYQGPEYGIDTQCLDDGCYFFVFTTADIWSEEQSWALTVNGEQVAGASYSAADNSTTFEYAFTIGDFECGCTDDFACNFDGVAPDWVENGTCEYITCAGCTDPENCFYDGPEFTIDDGSCCTDNCITIQMYDSWGDGWNGNTLTIKDLEGNVIQTATITSAQGSANTEVGCLPDGCYTVECGGGSFASEVSWDLLGVYGGTLSGVVQGATYFSVGGNNCIEGCSILCACNYDAAVNIPTDDICEFYGCGGCTYPGATNYDETAASDDGSCEFDFANPCPADLNEDGSVSTADLLQFLGAFGTVCE